MEKFLDDWRQDALKKHQYDAAIFIGDKLLALTKDDKDAFWLAQVHFSMGNYTRAQEYLSRKELIARNSSCQYLSAHCLLKQSKYEEALIILGEKNPTHLVHRASNSRRKLQHSNANARAGPPRQQKGPQPKKDKQEREEEANEQQANDIKFEAGMCYLRGICFAKQNAFDRAKECYKDAVRIDVQCFEAFDQLMKNSLMSPDEEWKFLDSLDFDKTLADGDGSAAQEASDFMRMLYTTRLSKYGDPASFSTAAETLSTHYNLSSNADLLLSRAGLLFTQCRFRDALALTQSILDSDKYNFSVYPLHLACLHELNEKNSLFLVAHDLADHHPNEPSTWLAVGVYYFTINKIAEARRYFSKSSMMDSHFGPAWIGFAHTFAAEGEHDQAISAYSTAARLFQGTHLPQLFLGMQNLQLNNLSLADEYLKTAYKLCSTDPLLLNEMGVVFYHQGYLQPAVNMFHQALTIAADIDSEPRAWLLTRANLAHAYRKMGKFQESLEKFEDVLRQGGRDCVLLCAKALVLMELWRPHDAVLALHEALSVNPQDPIATDLLNKALEESAETFSQEVNGADIPASADVSALSNGASNIFSDSPNQSKSNVEEQFERLLLRKKKSAQARAARIQAEGDATNANGLQSPPSAADDFDVNTSQVEEVQMMDEESL